MNLIKKIKIFCGEKRNGEFEIEIALRKKMFFSDNLLDMFKLFNKLASS